MTIGKFAAVCIAAFLCRSGLLALAAGVDGQIVTGDGARFWGAVERQGRQYVLTDSSGVTRTFPVESVEFVSRAELLKKFERWADEIHDEKDDDVDDYLELLDWCREQGLLQETQVIAGRILRRDPDNTEAKFARQWAQEQKRAEQKTRALAMARTRPADKSLLSNDDIQKIRFELIDVTDASSRVIALFRNNVLQRFLQDVSGRKGFRTPAEQRAFLRLSPQAQLRTIKEMTGSKYREDIDIPKDPPVMRTFRRHVLPIVAKSCGTRDCHGSKNDAFHLYTTRKPSEAVVYTSFYLMDTYESEAGRVIDRAHPQDSLLLVYGLGQPTSGRPSLRQEALQHPVAIKPIFRSTRDGKYRRILRWIESLDPVPPKYDLSLQPPGKSLTRRPPVAEEATPQPVPAAATRPAMPATPTYR